MSSPFQPLKCGLFCQTEAEFSLKFVVTALSLTDEDEDNGFEDILVTITFDGNVFKIDDFKETAEGGVELVGRGLDLRLTPEKFSEKLRTCPIMFNLSRGCNELGTVKLEFSECFMDAPKCEDFEKQSVSNDLKFIKENEMNGLMALICQVSREVNLNVFKGLKTPKKLAETKSIEKISNDSSLSYSCSGISTSGSTDREPLDADDSELFHRTTSSKTKSSRSKCQSDIAASLDICDYSGDQQTYCNACEKFSISGVTCDNKSLTKIQQVLFCKSEEKIPLVCDPCKVLTPAKKRICQECFEDLTVLPCNAPCPNCARHAQLQRKLISFKSQKVKKQEGEQIRNCIRSIVEEIFFDTKDQLIKDWQRLKKEPQKKKAKNVVTKKRRCTQESLKPYQSSPR